MVEAGQAHVQNLDHLAVRRQQQVGRLDVPMHQPALEGML